jgi:YD repeat-containing protein
MTAQNDPDAGAWTYAYDDAGRLTSQTDAKSQTTTLTYDTQVGRLATRQSVVGTGDEDLRRGEPRLDRPPRRDTAGPTQYDGAGRVSSVSVGAASGARDDEAERTRGQGEIAIMGGDNEFLRIAVPPHESGGQVQSVERAQRRRKRLRSASEDGSLEHDQVDRLEPLGNEHATHGRLLDRERALDTEAVQGSKGLYREQFARHESVRRAQLLERIRLRQNEPKQGRGVEVGNHLSARSSSRTARLLVCCNVGGATRTAAGRRTAFRTSSGPSDSYGTSRAIGVSRSMTVSVCPARTLRRCELRWALRSAIPTRVTGWLMT